MVTPPPPSGGRWERGGQRPHEGRRGGNSATSVAATSRRVMPTNNHGGDALRRLLRGKRRHRVADTAFHAWLCARIGKPRSGHGNAIEAGKRQGDGVADNPTAPPAVLTVRGIVRGGQNGRNVESLSGLHNVRCESSATAGGRPQKGAPLTGQDTRRFHNVRYVTPIQCRDGTRKTPCVDCAWTGG